MNSSAEHASIKRYVPRLIVHQLHASEAGQELSRRDYQGVILFVDIADSTGLADRLASEGPDGAERLSGILNGYFGKVIDIIEAHGGDTIRIDGDATIALWRDEAGLKAAALRAAQAAIALRDVFRHGHAGPELRLRHRLTLGVGQLTAVAFKSGPDRWFFMVTGQPIAAIAAVARAGEPDEIILADRLDRLLEPVADLQLADGIARLVAIRKGAETGPVRPPESVDWGGFDPRIRQLLPRIVVDRTDAGHAAWLAEFRILSVVYVQLANLCSSAADAAERICQAIGAVNEAIRPLREAVSDVLVGDKGVVATIACGMPPFAQENNAVRALEAARRTRSALAEIGVASSIGVATGRAFCGDVGNAFRREYLILGPVMNYGARLMQAAGDEILCDGATAQAAASHFEMSAPAPLDVKGRAEPLVVRRLDGPRRMAGHSVRAGALYGRERETRQLDRRLDELSRGRGGVLAVEAEPGAGKSRLLLHIAAAAQDRGYSVVHTSTSSIEQMTAYFVFREIVRQLLVRRTDPPVALPTLLRARLEEALGADPLGAKAALIEDILPLGIRDKGLAAQIIGPARRAGIEDLILRLFDRITAAGPLVLLVDDLHWIDDLSAQLLLAIAKQAPRLLLAVATRPRDGASSPHAAELLDTAPLKVSLPRLERESIKGMVCEILKVGNIPAALVDLVQARSEGLPFHAELLVQSLRDQGAIQVAEGRCRVAVSDIAMVAVPDSLRDIIISRIDTLPSDQQCVAKVASAIGRVFEFTMLRDVLPFRSDLPRLEENLEGLVRAGILDSPLSTRGTSYAFRHILIQEVTYELLTYAQREPLHRAIAEVLEGVHQSDLEPHYAVLADHWERAADPQKAIHYRYEAARLALRRYANRDALNQVEKIERQALRMHVALPLQRKAELARIRGDACHELSRFNESWKAFEACAAMSGIPLPATRVGLVTSVAAAAFRQALHRIGGCFTRSEAGALARDSLAAHIHQRLAEQAYFTSDALRVVHGTLTSLNRAERAGAIPEIIEGYGSLAIGLGTAGLHRAAGFYRDRSLSLAERLGGPREQGFARLLAAVYSFQAGKWKETVALATTGSEICQRIGDRFRDQSCRVVHGFTLIATGDYAGAQAGLASIGEDAEDVENVQVRAWVLAAFAVLDMLLGRSAESALARLSVARDDALPRAERVLCGGLEAAARMQAGDVEGAERVAGTVLEDMLRDTTVMGAAFISVAAVADVYLALLGRVTVSGQASKAALERVRAADRAVRQYAAKTRICRPRSLLISGRFCMARGRRAEASWYWERALGEARGLGMPLEEALCHLALAGAPGSAERRQKHRSRGVAIMGQLGARPWLGPTVPAPSESSAIPEPVLVS